MHTKTVVKGLAAALMLVLPLGCGSSGSTTGTSGSSTGGSATGGGASSSSTSIGTGTSGGTTGAATVGGSSTGGATASGSATGGSSTGGASGTGGAAGTGGGIRGFGASCTYNASSGADSCTQYDLECTSTVSWVFCEGLDYPCPPDASNRGGAGTCVLPEEIAPCDSSVGCQDGGTLASGESNDFVCVAGLSSGDACLYACTQSTDCANISESCQNISGTNACFYNYCDVNAEGQLVGPYFNTCDASGTGDGECLSYGGVPPFGAVCYQNGSVAQGDVCQTYRTSVSNAQQCVFGQFCVPQPSNQDVGVCMQLTDEPGVTVTHPCTDTSDLVWEDIIGADFAVCVPHCPDDGGACPANLTCRSIPGVGQGCVP